SEGLEKGYDRVQQLLSQLEAHGAEVSTEDANHKFLRSLPSLVKMALTMRTKPDVDTLSIDDLYNNLRVFEQELTSTSKSSASAQNAAFVSHRKSSTNKVKSGHTGVYSTYTPTSLNNIQEREVPAGFADEVIYSLFAKQSEDLDVLHEDLEQIEYPSKGTNDGKKRDSYYQDQGAGKKEQNQNCLLTMNDVVVNWGEHTVEEEKTNHALMAINSNNEQKTILTTFDNKIYKTNSFKGVSHPLTGDYTPKPQEEIDDSLYVYGKKGPQKPEVSDSDDNSTKHSTCQSNDSEGSCGNTSEHNSETKVESISVPNEMSMSKPKVNTVSYNVNTVRSRQPVSTRTSTALVLKDTGKLALLLRPQQLYYKEQTRPNSNYDSGPTFIRTVNAKGPQGSPKLIKAWWMLRHMTCNKDHWMILKNAKGILLPFEVAKATLLMPDENQILLKFLRQHNMYSFDMKTPSLSKDYACLIAKATCDESKLWHRSILQQTVEPMKVFYYQMRMFLTELQTFKTQEKAADYDEFLLMWQNRSYQRSMLFSLLGFVDPDHRARIQKGTIDKTLFIKKDKEDIMLVQVYVDDIIFGSTRKPWCDEFKALMKGRFQMSSMFDLASVKTAITPMETKMALTKDKEAADVDVTPTTSHLNAMKRIFKYLKGKPNLGLWYHRELSFDLEAFSDSDYARANLDRKSTIGEIGSSSIARKTSVSSRRKSLSPKGVRVGEEVETIGSVDEMGLPLTENLRTS
ncbi:hypothetical protein Tco_0261708, partial [Tanacetum coccineum]